MGLKKNFYFSVHSDENCLQQILLGPKIFFFFCSFYMFLHLVLIYSGLFQKKAILGAQIKMEFCIVLNAILLLQGKFFKFLPFINADPVAFNLLALTSLLILIQGIHMLGDRSQDVVENPYDLWPGKSSSFMKNLLDWTLGR